VKIGQSVESEGRNRYARASCGGHTEGSDGFFGGNRIARQVRGVPNIG
jgi:hypothetical protein